MDGTLEHLSACWCVTNIEIPGTKQLSFCRSGFTPTHATTLLMSGTSMKVAAGQDLAPGWQWQSQLFPSQVLCVNLGLGRRIQLLEGARGGKRSPQERLCCGKAQRFFRPACAHRSSEISVLLCESMECSLFWCQRESNKVPFVKFLGSTEGNLLKIKALLCPLEKDFSALWKEGRVAACVGASGSVLTQPGQVVVMIKDTLARVVTPASSYNINLPDTSRQRKSELEQRPCLLFYAVGVSSRVPERLSLASIKLCRKKLLPDLTNFAWLYCTIKQNLLSGSWMPKKTKHKGSNLINRDSNLLRRVIC